MLPWSLGTVTGQQRPSLPTTPLPRETQACRECRRNPKGQMPSDLVEAVGRLEGDWELPSHRKREGGGTARREGKVEGGGSGRPEGASLGGGQRPAEGRGPEGPKHRGPTRQCSCRRGETRRRARVPEEPKTACPSSQADAVGPPCPHRQQVLATADSCPGSRKSSHSPAEGRALGGRLLL